MRASEPHTTTPPVEYAAVRIMLVMQCIAPSAHHNMSSNQLNVLTELAA
jgi:hypothetical protein